MTMHEAIFASQRDIIMYDVKAISLDDIGDISNPIAMAGSGDKTKDRALHYNPQYEDLSDSLNMGRLRPMERTQHQEEEGFSLSSTMTRFSEIFGSLNFQSGHRNYILLGILGVVLLAAGLYFYLGDAMIAGDTAPTDTQAEINGGGTAAPVAAAPAPQQAKEAKPAPKVINVNAKVETTTVKEIPGNPYWKLPNPVATMGAAPAPMTTQQVESWRGGLMHPFSYQRYKSVAEMRAKKMDGSAAIFYEALAQPKFWTRMEALLGIAEQGIPIDTDSMHAAVGDARPDLVRNYFRRFRKNYTDATAHVLRQALRVVDAKSRFLILTQLAMHRSELNDMYLIAGLNDIDPRTKAFAQQTLSVQPALATTQQAYDKAMSEDAILVTTPRNKSGAQDIKVEKIPVNMNVEEVYFINDEEAVPVSDTPKEINAVREDDGFNDLDYKDKEPSESNQN